MFKRTIPITQARHELSRLPEEFAADDASDAVAITRRGKPILAVLPWDLYDSLVETLEILGDEDLMAALRQSIKEMESEKLIPWDEARSVL
ncbi:type II toxin-antitoxin system Phd/YefM family antitoxin [Candidatus Bipolaricaulota bacterium]|nr:type II toxin-antitoxin system Phd/YefM family antitoxin [Candidatus Bipolaricaulota bacterium]